MSVHCTLVWAYAPDYFVYVFSSTHIIIASRIKHIQRISAGFSQLCYIPILHADILMQSCNCMSNLLLPLTAYGFIVGLGLGQSFIMHA